MTSRYTRTRSEDWTKGHWDLPTDLDGLLAALGVDHGPKLARRKALLRFRELPAWAAAPDALKAAVQALLYPATAKAEKAAGHDVTDEARDEKGEWAAGERPDPMADDPVHDIGAGELVSDQDLLKLWVNGKVDELPQLRLALKVLVRDHGIRTPLLYRGGRSATGLTSWTTDRAVAQRHADGGAMYELPPGHRGIDVRAAIGNYNVEEWGEEHEWLVDVSDSRADKAAAHDVSDEARDPHGEWTAGAGAEAAGDAATVAEHQRIEEGEEGRTASRSASVVSPAEFARVKALALSTVQADPAPTKAEVAHNRQLLAHSTRAGGELRGNSHDRSVRTHHLLTKFGDGEHCACVYCGRTLDDGTLTQDKIYTAPEGGRYRMANLLPACYDCNAHRGDSHLDPASMFGGA